VSDGDSDTNSTGDGDGDGDGGNEGPVIICEPEETRCVEGNDLVLETCAPTGLEWEQSDCLIYQTCISCFGESADDCVAACVGPCEQLEGIPSSEGCSFYATSMYQAGQTIMDPVDAIVVGNSHPELTAMVTLYFVPEGSNIEEFVKTVPLAPGDSEVFELPAELTTYNAITSGYRSGLVHHVTSDLPIVAYLHSPYEGTSSNGSSMLLPEHVMTGNYVIYGGAAYTDPSYFSLIALENQTTVKWRPRVNTAGDNLPLPMVLGGGEGEQLLNRFDNIRIDSSSKDGQTACEQDLSGTVIEADKPVWVVSAVRGSRIPLCAGAVIEGCPTQVSPACMSGSDFLQEQNLPLEYWGREYVGAHSPVRGTESHYWRIYAGDDNVNVTVTPEELGIPIQEFDFRGDFRDIEVPTGTNLVFNGDAPFMPVQSLAGHWVSNSIGSPAMVQMVPTAQFLNRYVFVTGHLYDLEYVQVIREVGTADVTLRDVMGMTTLVTGWETVGDWEIANMQIMEGSYEITGDDPFGIVQYGYTILPDPLDPTNDPSSAYAYPGGMKAEVIFIP
jgi:hypothetical protein